MDNNDTQQSAHQFKGRVEHAKYQDPFIPGYQGNPLIEALPPIWSKEQVIDLLQDYPHYKEDHRMWPVELRLHLIRNVQKFFEVLPIHLDLEQRLSSLLRIGYEARNPVIPGFYGSISDRVGMATSKIRQGNPSAITGLAMIGLSGVGKTTALTRILSLYPQVIIHNRYHDKDFHYVQVVWLKLESPFDGSTKGLCLSFFQAFDDILGTNYYANYARHGRATVDEMLQQMARVSLLHGLGVLVIDEIQHLNEAKSGGATKMLNFFVQLMNTIGMPVIPVGTYKAYPILAREFRQARRSAGQGDLIWDRMKEDETWQLFLESLWMYQYTKNRCPLASELSHALYDVTQGITDLAVKVYMLAQIRSITRGDEEVLTESLIRSVAFDSLRLVNPILEALKTGNILELHKVDDVLPVDIEPFLQEALRNSNTSPQPESATVANKVTEEKDKTSEQPTFPSPEDTPRQGQGSNTLPIKDSRKKTIKTKPHNNLFETVSQHTKLNITAYEALQKAGYLTTDEDLQKDM